MTRKDSYEERTEALLEPIAVQNGCDIYDVEYVKEGSSWYLRAYIDKAGGVTITDCEQVSRALSEKLDEEDFIPDAYVLEVSSPGLGRALKKDRHLAKSIGEQVEVKIYKPMDGQKEFAGRLKAFDKDAVTIEILTDTGVKDMVLAKSDIAVIRLALDF